MKKKRCPYCGRRISYTAALSSRRKAEYICTRCGKEMRVVINRSIIIVFIVFALVSVGIMAGWIFAGIADNPLGILCVALPLIIFAIISPRFVGFVPLKKYKKSMEAKKAGIEYSDNLMVSEITGDQSPLSQDSGQFRINSDVFNKIRAERNAAREQMSRDENTNASDDVNIYHPERTEEETSGKYVHVIDNVSENHSYDDAPLKKIRSETPHTVSRQHHYISNDAPTEDKKPDKSNTNRYSSNRRF